MVKVSLQTLSKRELIALILALQKEGDLSSQALTTFIEKATKVSVPSFIFTKDLGALESICKYLKENQGLTYHQIAQLLDRNDRTIWTTYHNACKKREQLFVPEKSVFFIPISLIKKRTLSVLETIVVHLKEEYEFTYHTIAELLQRNERTIWTVYQRAKKK